MTYLVTILYIVAFAMFIYGLSGLTGPKTAVRGNYIAAAGMAVAVVAVLIDIRDTDNWGSDRRRPGRGRDPRCAAGPEDQDDRDAAAGRAVQRRGRWHRRADRVGRVPRLRRLHHRRRRAVRAVHRRIAVRRDHRFGLVLGGLARGVLQAAGTAEQELREEGRRVREAVPARQHRPGPRVHRDRRVHRCAGRPGQRPDPRRSGSSRCSSSPA